MLTPEERLAQYREQVRDGTLTAPPKRVRRQKVDPNQLELLDPAEAERREKRYAQTLAYRERRKTCPDGRGLPEGMDWCGRCGEIVFAYSMVINHDLGYCGCPVEFDPVWKDDAWRREIHSFGARGRLDRDTLNQRWDRQFFADCECGDACGNHKEDGLCLACYRCHEYRPRESDD
jgi:hypothetical protein